MFIIYLCNLVKISHTIFSISFGIISIIVNYDPNLSKMSNIPLIILCIFFARNSAMAFNRIVDISFDRLNPRTKNRELIQGKLSKKSVILFIFFNSILFFFTTYQIHFIFFILAPILLILLFFYSFWKRFSFLSHFYLGMVIGLTPIAADLAINFSISSSSILLFLWMALWISGFDIIYSISDIYFDQSQSLYSIASKFGSQIALNISKILYSLSLVNLFIIGYIHHFSLYYYFFLFLILLNFIIQFYLIHLNKTLLAFSLNLYIPIIYLLIILIEKFIFH